MTRQPLTDPTRPVRRRGAAARHPAWRWGTAVAALVLLAPGLLEIHSAGIGHSGRGTDGEAVFACDAGHGRTVHVERARPVEPHDCAACMHRLHSRAGASGAVAVAVPGTGEERVPATQTPPPPVPPLSRAPSRGPPLA